MSGGQSDELATAHLNAMNQIVAQAKSQGDRSMPYPWALTYSYGRALQAASIKAWGGKPDNVQAAQAALNHRSRMNSLAAMGKYQSELEQKKAA